MVWFGSVITSSMFVERVCKVWSELRMAVCLGSPFQFSVTCQTKSPQNISYLDFSFLSLFAGNLCFGLCTLAFPIICHTPNDVTPTFAVCHIIAIQNADTISCPGCNSSYETYTSIEGRQKKKIVCFSRNKKCHNYI